MSKKKKLGDLITDNKENAEKLSAADIKVASDKDTKEKKISKLILENKQNSEELSAAYKIIATQEKEIKKQAEALIRADKEKEKQRTELISAKKELAHKAELTIINKELNLQIIERKKTEEALKESNEKYSKAFQSSPYSMTISSLKEGRFIEVNDAFTMIFGFTREEALSNSTIGLDLWKDTEERNSVISALRSGKDVEGKEFAFRKKNGEIGIGLFSAKIIYINKEPYIISSIDDITERKQAEKLLKESEQKSTSIMENSADAIFIANQQGKYVYTNKAVSAMLGFTSDEMKNKTIADISPPNKTEEYFKFFKQKLNKGKGVTEIELLKKDGNYISTDLNAVILPDGTIYGSCRDITERKKAEEALKASETKYHAIFENVQDVFYQTDLAGTVLEVSPSIENILGFSRNEIIGKPITKLSFDFKSKDMFFYKLKENGELRDYELRLKTKTGEFKYTSINAQLIFDADGKPNHIDGVIRDITQRKLDQVELQASKEFLKNIINVVASPVFVKDDNYKYVLANNALCSLLKIPIEKIIGSTDSEYFPEEQLKVFTEKDNEVLKTGKKNINEEYLTDGTGKVRTIVTKKTLYTDTAGNKFLVGVINDITERKQAENDLIIRNKLNLLKAKVWEAVSNKSTNEADLINLMLEEAGNVLNISRASFFQLDEKKKSFVAKYMWYLPEVGSTKKVEIPAKYVKSYLGQESFQIPLQLNKTIRFFASPILKQYNIKSWMAVAFGNKQNPSGLFSFTDCNREREWSDLEIEVLIDLSNIFKSFTIQRKAEESLLKLSYAVEQSPVSIIITNLDGNIEYVNPKVTEITGYKPVELIGKNPRIFNSSEKPKSESQNLWETISSGKQWFGEFHNKKKNGELYWGAASISPITNERGEITHYMAIEEDITERKKTELELIKAKEKAEESDRLKSAFLTNMSHEIRTPMNGILGFAELLKEPNLSTDEQNSFIEIIGKSGQRMLNTINSIIDISKIESGLVKVNIKEANINEKMEFAYKFFNPEVESKGIQFFLKYGLPDKEAIINTDNEMVYGILTNLVKNAIKFTHKGSIELGYVLKSDSDPAELEFYVKDTGIGIPKDRLDAIFDRFIKADIEDKQAFQGSGLGLTISKSYVEMLGGKMWIESEEGRGSTFYFTIPYNIESEDKNVIGNAVPADNNEVKIKNLKILIVEDEEISGMLLEIMVNTFAKKILKARTGVEAIEACRLNPDIDLILMDIQMPQMNGYEATLQIRQFNKDVIIIAQTAFGLSGNREKAIEAGCNDYILKPIKKDHLVELMEKYFQKE